jgi:predicted dehydrogenase
MSLAGQAQGRHPANDRIVTGAIGMGAQGLHDLKTVMRDPGVQAVAVCDVSAGGTGYPTWYGTDRGGRGPAKQAVEAYYAEKTRSGAYRGCAVYSDFRELLARDDIDAVIIATPDHWHAVCAVEAARAGKDIYCEKPLSLTIAEARAMVNAVRQYGRVFQTGSQQRSGSNFRFACELVRNGYIGDVKHVTVNVGGPSGPCDLPPQPVPEHLDWDMWLGPAPWRPFHQKLHPARWRAYRDYSGGGMTDWGAHHFDIAQWALGMDDTGPVEIIPPDGKEVRVLTYRYATGVVMTRDKANGVLFTGTQGRIEVNRGYLKTWPETLQEVRLGPDEVRLYESNNHHADWLSAIRTRSKPICDVDIGARSVTVCHLGNIAYQLGRPLRWDPEAERFVGDDDANRLLDRAKRSPWHL